MQTLENSPFKAYDIRGRTPDELNPDIARVSLLSEAIHLMPPD